MAIAAALGFLVPTLDIFNHLQVPIFWGAVAGLTLVLLIVPAGTWKWMIAGFTGAGLIASAMVYVPEVVSSFVPRAPLPSDGRVILKAMTDNLFGLNYDMARTRDYVFAEDPDIVAFQEYFPEQRGRLHDMLIERYPYFALCTGGKRANIGLYSRLPFSHRDDGACRETATPQQRTSRIVASFTLADGTAFTVMTTHLDWPFPVARQEQQRADLTEAINAITGPLIVMGDMNSTPWSYAMRRMVSETSVERQTRNLITYPLAVGGDDGLMRTIPFLPLDQVLTRDGVEVHELHAGPDTGSDHLPVVFTFSVKRPG
jgi:endonuclease/exonuclease/phosphatase (EEP) superfamily protein YafD